MTTMNFASCIFEQLSLICYSYIVDLLTSRVILLLITESFDYALMFI